MFLHLRILLCALMLGISASSVWAGATAATHAPIGVMKDHMHKQGEWMTSYRYMYMDMGSNYISGDEVDLAAVHNEFMVAPTSMDVHMHMVGMMYGLTDQVTMMVMLPYVEKSMDHQMRNGVRFTTKSDGVGDVQLSGIFRLIEEVHHDVHLNFGVSFPTGSIKRSDATPAAPNGTVLPYSMQMGSGTYDLLPGITYNGHSGQMFWGAQLMSTNRLGKNDRDYALGDRYEVSSWLVWQMQDWISSSLRIKKSVWGNIDGRDTDLNAGMVQTADPQRQGGKRLDVLVGMNLIGTQDNILHDHRLAVEFGFPVDIQVNGPQLVSDWSATVGWQKAF